MFGDGLQCGFGGEEVAGGWQVAVGPAAQAGRGLGLDAAESVCALSVGFALVRGVVGPDQGEFVGGQPFGGGDRAGRRDRDGRGGGGRESVRPGLGERGVAAHPGRAVASAGVAATGCAEEGLHGAQGKAEGGGAIMAHAGNFLVFEGLKVVGHDPGRH